MKPETIERIREKLTADVEIARTALLRNIECSSVDGVSPLVEGKIKEYKAAYKILEDFEEWAEEQEEDDGN